MSGFKLLSWLLQIVFPSLLTLLYDVFKCITSLVLARAASAGYYEFQCGVATNLVELQRVCSCLWICACTLAVRSVRNMLFVANFPEGRREGGKPILPSCFFFVLLSPPCNRFYIELNKLMNKWRSGRESGVGEEVKKVVKREVRTLRPGTNLQEVGLERGNKDYVLGWAMTWDGAQLLALNPLREEWESMASSRWLHI